MTDTPSLCPNCGTEGDFVSTLSINEMLCTNNECRVIKFKDKARG